MSATRSRVRNAQSSTTVGAKAATSRSSHTRHSISQSPTRMIRARLATASVGRPNGASRSRAVLPSQPDAPVTSTRSFPRACAASARALVLTNPVTSQARDPLPAAYGLASCASHRPSAPPPCARSRGLRRYGSAFLARGRPPRRTCSWTSACTRTARARRAVDAELAAWPGPTEGDRGNRRRRGSSSSIRKSTTAFCGLRLPLASRKFTGDPWSCPSPRCFPKTCRCATGAVHNSKFH